MASNKNKARIIQAIAQALESRLPEDTSYCVFSVAGFGDSVAGVATGGVGQVGPSDKKFSQALLLLKKEVSEMARKCGAADGGSAGGPQIFPPHPTVM
jgi:hypothetical protein